jgi:hypothetical protein
LDTAQRTSHVAATIGTKIAVTQLKDQVRWMRRMRGKDMRPLVQLSSAPFRTQYGMRKRPDFQVVDWVDLGDPGAIPAPAPKPLLPTVDEETL